MTHIVDLLGSQGWGCISGKRTKDISLHRPVQGGFLPVKWLLGV
jgi:hypothetical protein